MWFSSKGLRKVLMGVYNFSLIISNKYPYKMFSSNLKKYGFSYTGDSINQAPLIWPSWWPSPGKLSDEKQFSQNCPIKGGFCIL